MFGQIDNNQQRPRDPLANHAKYVKVIGCNQLTSCVALPSSPSITPQQVCDLNAGAFGSVVLALEKTTQRQVAIKFIPYVYGEHCCTDSRVYAQPRCWCGPPHMRTPPPHTGVGPPKSPNM